MFARHTGIAQAAYSDLLQLLHDDTVAAILGTPTKRNVNGRDYWYDRTRIGTGIRERYLGEDSPEMRARIERHREIAQRARERRRECGRLVRILRAEGLRGSGDDTGPLLAALAKSGVFRLGGTLVGTNAYRLYEGELGVRFPLDEAAMTRDIDVAQFEKLSIALGDQVDPKLEEAFAPLKFEPVPGLEPGKTWRWVQGGGLSVEFLTPAFRSEEIRSLPAMGVNAMALRHLDYLIAEPIHAAVIYRSGILVQVPRPERYAIHKLIVADRRRAGVDADKAQKDRRQAGFLIDILAEDRPGDLLDAYEDALDRGPKWRQRIEASLGRMPKARAVLERL